MDDDDDKVLVAKEREGAVRRRSITSKGMEVRESMGHLGIL